jgi:hypothetical protein
MDWQQQIREEAKVVDLRPEQIETEHELPFPVYINGEMVSREYSNAYTGQSVLLNPECAAVYEVTIACYNIAMAEGRDDPSHWGYEYYRRGVTWMQEYYIDEYMVLLD